jgi:nucleoside-diphosphate-sugar epimerase
VTRWPEATDERLAREAPGRALRTPAAESAPRPFTPGGGAPRSEEELEDVLATPTSETIAAMTRLDGDVLVLGAGGKIGPSLARLTRRALLAGRPARRVTCVSRFSSPGVAEGLESAGIDTIACDLLSADALSQLPDAPNVIYLAGFKFGASARPDLLWALNCYLPAMVADRFAAARIVALSTGNVYPPVPVDGGGAVEETLPDPIGEYAQSCLGRERLLQYVASRHGTKLALVRLNYASDLRYGVLVDLAQHILRAEPVDVSMGFFNTIWQADANNTILQMLELCSNPATVLNVTGPETLAVRESASRLADVMGTAPPVLVGSEGSVALLSNASRCHSLLGAPRVSGQTLLDWTAEWAADGGRILGKPTHFEVIDGRY